MKYFFLLAFALFMGSCCNKNCETPVATDVEIAKEPKAIRLNVFYTLNEDADPAAAKSAGDSLVAASRNDVGCISYDMYESVTTPRQFIIIETWENDSVLDIHSNAPHFKHFVPQLQALGNMQVQRFLIEE
ncbi:MAG: antibiotic biosynthesis monooxygenase [Muribaculaceae bacterium]|nr:antibiotic biosynthesis monooxygenase [Muribaculaceae bacterium]